MNTRLEEIEKNMVRTREIPQEISTENVNLFINQLLQNSASNFGWLPDVFEKHLDRRIVLLILGALTEVFKTASIDIAGSKLRFSLAPATKIKTEENMPVNFDIIIKDFIKNLLDTAQVNFLNHQLRFEFE